MLLCHLSNYIDKSVMLILLVEFQFINDSLHVRFFLLFAHVFDLMLNFNCFLFNEFRDVLDDFLEINFEEHDEMFDKHDDNEESHDVVILEVINAGLDEAVADGTAATYHVLNLCL